MSEKIPVTRAIIRSMAEEATNQLKLAQQIDHPGESGRAREQILTAFIRRIVPSHFGVSTGFVVDATGGISRQVDVVIYRTDYAPILEIGSVKHFLVESVIAVIEVKAAISSTERLKQALDNIISVKQLDRSNNGQNYILIGRNQGNPLNPDDFCHQIYGAIVTEHSLVRETLKQQLLEFLRINPRRVWPNLYVDVHNLVAAYASNDDKPVSSDSTGYTDLWFDESPQHPNRNSPPLLFLAQHLIDLFRVAPTVDFSPGAYFSVGRRWGEHWAIEATDSAS